jgi:hypothetical protein
MKKVMYFVLGMAVSFIVMFAITNATGNGIFVSHDPYVRVKDMMENVFNDTFDEDYSIEIDDDGEGSHADVYVYDKEGNRIYRYAIPRSELYG